MSLLGAFELVGGLSPTPFISYAILAVFTGIFLINIKGIPGFWHVCFLKVGGYNYFVADLLFHMLGTAFKGNHNTAFPCQTAEFQP